jgi:predicted alpha-1,6-mannanase (GH76 family)
MDFDAGPAVQALQAWYHPELGLYHWSEDENDIPSIIKDVDHAGFWPGLIERFEDTDRWWCTANATGALIDYMSNTGDRTYLSVLDNTFILAPTAFAPDYQHGTHGDLHVDAGHVDTTVVTHVDVPAPHVDTPHADLTIPGKLTYTNFLNNFHDDDGWWALTWIKAYDLTRDPKYLNMAVTIFRDMAVGEGGWDGMFGGGIYWGKDHKGPDGELHYKNAIANELFMAVAARLYLRQAGSAPAFPGTNDASYKRWAKEEADWFLKCGLIGTPITQVGDPSPSMVPSRDHPVIITNMINDSLNDDGNNDGTKPFWTYNHGVILHALCDVSIITGDPKYRVQAEQIADTAVKYFSDINGILTEVHDDPNDNYSSDSCMFKGPFIRNLAALFVNDHNPKYSAFITNNANTVLNNGVSSQFGARWSQKPDSVDFMRQTAAIDAINAAKRVLIEQMPISLKNVLARVGQTPPTSVRGAIAWLTPSVRAWVAAMTT